MKKESLVIGVINTLIDVVNDVLEHETLEQHLADEIFGTRTGDRVTRSLIKGIKNTLEKGE